MKQIRKIFAELMAWVHSLTLRQRLRQLRAFGLSMLWRKIKKSLADKADSLCCLVHAFPYRLRIPPTRVSAAVGVEKTGGMADAIAQDLKRSTNYAHHPRSRVGLVFLDAEDCQKKPDEASKWIKNAQKSGAPLAVWLHSVVAQETIDRLCNAQAHFFVSGTEQSYGVQALPEQRRTLLPSYANMRRYNPLAAAEAFSVGLIVDAETSRMQGLQEVMEEYLYFAGQDDARLWFLDDVNRELLGGKQELAACCAGVVAQVDDVDGRHTCDVLINLTQEPGSPTMAARRMASGQWLLSAKEGADGLWAIDSLTGERLRVAQTLRGLRRHLEPQRKRVQCVRAGVRRHSAEALLEAVEAWAQKPIRMRRTVTVLACTRNPECIPNILENYERQTFPDKRLIILIHTPSEPDGAPYKAHARSDVRIACINAERFTFGEALNQGVLMADTVYVTKMDDDDYYAPHYLADLMDGLCYTNARILGHNSFFLYIQGKHRMYCRKPGRQYEESKFVCGATLLFEREVLRSCCFRKASANIDGFFCKDATFQKIPIACLDAFNLLVLRTQRGKEHTWKISDELLAAQCLPCYDAYSEDIAMHRAYLTPPPEISHEDAKRIVSV